VFEMPQVIVVDDDKDTADTLEMLIGAEGFEACAFGDFREAILSLDKSTPCIALIDFHNHKDVMNVQQFIYELRERVLDVKIVVLSGDNRVRLECDRLRVDEFLLKPSDPRHVLNIVKEYCPIGSK
jgi:DNA-binding NtrC family response regulator